jgi:hypothetical protein
MHRVMWPDPAGDPRRFPHRSFRAAITLRIDRGLEQRSGTNPVPHRSVMTVQMVRGPLANPLAFAHTSRIAAVNDRHKVFWGH